MSDGTAAFLRFRELERQAREALEADPGGDQARPWVRSGLARVYRGEAQPGTDALRNLARPLHDQPVDARSYRRVSRISGEFAAGLGLAPGAWAAGPAPGWTTAVAEVADAELAAVPPEPAPGSDAPSPAGWAYAVSLSNAEHFLRGALAADPRGDEVELQLDVALAPLYVERVAPSAVSLEALDDVQLEPATRTAVEGFAAELAGGLSRSAAAWAAGVEPGWEEALAEEAPWWLARAAARREVAARGGLPLPEPAPPTLLDDPAWQALLEVREHEQRLRAALPDRDGVLRLDQWLRPVYDGASDPGPLALSAAPEQAATLAQLVRSRPASSAGWRHGLAAVAPAWLAAADARARTSQTTWRDRLRGLGGR